jgi:hypothetical protein
MSITWDHIGNGLVKAECIACGTKRYGLTQFGFGKFLKEHFSHESEALACTDCNDAA